MKLTLDQKIARRAKVYATAQKYLGEPVHSIAHLDYLANTKKSVFCTNSWGLLPATVVMNMTARTVLNAIRDGRIFCYNPKSK